MSQFDWVFFAGKQVFPLSFSFGAFSRLLSTVFFVYVVAWLSTFLSFWLSRIQYIDIPFSYGWREIERKKTFFIRVLCTLTFTQTHTIHNIIHTHPHTSRLSPSDLCAGLLPAQIYLNFTGTSKSGYVFMFIKYTLNENGTFVGEYSAGNMPSLIFISAVLKCWRFAFLCGPRDRERVRAKSKESEG